MHLLSAFLFILLLLTFSLLDYQSLYYSTLETFGTDKRDLIIEQVSAASSAKVLASKEFQHTLNQFKSLTKYENDEIETIYKKIEKRYRTSEKAVEEVQRKIERVEKLSANLFAQWHDELKDFSSMRLREESEKKLAETKISYLEMISLMKKAEHKMQPVLATLSDSTLLLRHNLNATAFSSMQNELERLNLYLELAVDEMNDAIIESSQLREELNQNISITEQIQQRVKDFVANLQGK